MTIRMTIILLFTITLHSVPVFSIVGKAKNFTACQWQGAECHSWDMVLIFILTSNVGEDLFNRTRDIIHNITNGCHLSPERDRAKFYTILNNQEGPWYVSEEEFVEDLHHEATFNQSTINCTLDTGDTCGESYGDIAFSLYKALGDLRSSGSSGRGKAIVIVSNAFNLKNEMDQLMWRENTTLQKIAEYGVSPLRILDSPFDPLNDKPRFKSPAYENLTEYSIVAQNYTSLDSYIQYLTPCLKDASSEDSEGFFLFSISGAVIFLLIITVIVLVLLQLHRRRKYQRSIQVARMQLSHQNSLAYSDRSDPVPLELIDHHWEVPRNRLRVFYDRKLGSGAFCDVHEGILLGGVPLNATTQMLGQCEELTVAVKSLHEHKANFSDELIQEMNFMKSLSYQRHLLNLVACITIGRPVLLLVEMCSNGDLLTYVRDRKSALSESPNCEAWHELFSFCWQVCDGLLYLSSKGFVHRDIAARNILIDEAMTAKVGDFGLCRRMQLGSYTNFGGRLPVRWLALESLLNYEFSTKSDVWSFGVLLYEVFSLGSVPYANIDPADLIDFLKSKKRLAKPRHCPQEIYDMMLECWTEEAEQRPMFNTLQQRLAAIIERETEQYGYIELNDQ